VRHCDVDAGGAQRVRAVLLRRDDDQEAGDEERRHRGEDRERVPARRQHPPEHEDLRHRDQEQREHLDEVREAGGFSNGTAEFAL
jgi:hypothetical protein